MTCHYCAELYDKYPGARVRPCSHESPEWQSRLDTFTPLHKAIDGLHQSMTDLPQGPGTGSARVFLHPRVLAGPAIGVLQACLEERGYDLNEIRVGPPSAKGFCELTRLRKVGAHKELLLERFNGSQFVYWPEGTTPTEGNVA